MIEKVFFDDTIKINNDDTIKIHHDVTSVNVLKEGGSSQMKKFNQLFQTKQ